MASATLVLALPGNLTEEINMATKFLVAYAKITMDKANGITLVGVFLGGIGDSFQEAETIARECVNTVRGGTIIPRVVKLEGEGKIIDALYDATERFEHVTANMREAEETLHHRRKKL